MSLKKTKSLFLKTILACTFLVTLSTGVAGALRLSTTTDSLRSDWKTLHEVNVINVVPSQGLALWGLYSENAKRSLLPVFDYGEVERVRIYDDLGKGFIGMQKMPDGRILNFEPGPLAEETYKEMMGHMIDLSAANKIHLSEAEAVRRSARYFDDFELGKHEIYNPVITYQQNKLQHLGFMITEYTSYQLKQQVIDQRNNIFMLSVGLLSSALFFI